MTINLDRPEGLEAALADDIPAPVVLTGDGALKTPYRPRIVGVGTATSAAVYSQQEVLDAFRITDPKIRSVFANSAIDRRHLTLPEPDADGVRAPSRRATCSTSTRPWRRRWAPRHCAPV